MKALRSFETSGTTSPTTRRHISGDLNPWKVFRMARNLNTCEHVNYTQVAGERIQLQNFVTAVTNIGVSYTVGNPVNR